MRVVKKINHNVLLVEEDGKEKIMMGRGIGFSAVIGEEVAPSVAEKIFIPDSKEKTKRFTELVDQIPFEFIDFTETLVHDISKLMGKELDSALLITLTDHIYFSIERQKSGIQVSAMMMPEMKLYYPKEYEVAADVVERIEKAFDIDLGISEIGFITMHIINAELGEENSVNSLKILTVTSDLLDFIEKNGREDLDKESLDFHRLMIHVKFLVQRLLYRENLAEEDFTFFNETFKESDSYKLALKVKGRIESEHALQMPENELNYLAVHLMRIQ